MLAKQRGSLPKVYPIFKRSEKEQHSSHPSDNRCLPASNLKPEERELVVDSTASVHMISEKDLNSSEMDTLTTSRSPTTVITANGDVQTHEEATVYVTELDIFLTMKVLEDTPAVLSLGKLCDEHGYSYERSKNHISLKTVFGYNATQRTSFRSWFQACHRVLHPTFPMTPSRQESDHPKSSSSSSTSPTMISSTVSNDGGRDLCGIDSYPVTLSNAHAERKER